MDEAQSLPLELLEEIRLLANIETNDEKLLSVIMAGQPELADRLNDQALRQLKQRVALRCDLRPLTLQETAAYLAGRIKAAGGVGAQVFTREAVTLIHERSQGIPRTISVIADNALLSGFALEQRPVDSQDRAGGLPRTSTCPEPCGDAERRSRRSRRSAKPTCRRASAGAPAPAASATPPPRVALGSLLPARIGPGRRHRGSESVTDETAPRRRFFGIFGAKG